ncbi:MATE family efflux transporter [Spirillospora sp. CA-294931]|uniref:MATE family efflux transporter n=1 Tax=Spirillospora sp. CA-294931 TaxID=3240042 RepID=UPI003D8B1558
MTAGPAPGDRELRSSIVRLARPMTLGGVVGVFVPITVLAMVSRMGINDLSIRALYMPMAFLFLAIQMAFDVSNQAAAALCRGRDRIAEIPAMALSMAGIWAVTGLALSAVLLGAAPLLADLLQVEPGVRGGFVSFLRWMSVANIALLGPVLSASSLRGVGRAGAAASITLSNAAIEIGGVAALGYGTPLGVMAVPVATVAAGVSGTVLGLFHLRRAGVWAPVGWRPEAARRLLSVGVPVGVSYVLIFATNLALLWVLGPFGPKVRNGFSTAATVQSLVIIPAIALGSATAIVMNQQRGAGRQAWLAATMRAGLRVAALVYVVLALVAWLGRDLIGLLMAGDSRTADETGRYLVVVGLTYVSFGLVLMSLTAIEQIGGGPLVIALNTVYSAGVIGIGGWLARAWDDPGALYWTIAVCNVGGVLAVLAAARFVRRLSRAEP